MPDARLSSPAVLRNREPLLDVLRRVLPARALVLEIASGSGEHAVFFAEHLPQHTFQPTEADATKLASVAAWRGASPLPNLLAPVRLDVCETPWPVERADAILCINMIHASPWESTPALFDGAARILPEGGRVLTYGAYKIGGAHTAESNVAFDRWLREDRDPRWGVRDLEAVVDVARERGLTHVESISMPANNFVQVFERRSTTTR